MTPLALLMDFLTVLVALALVLGLAFFSIRMLKKVQSGAPSGDEIRFIRSLPLGTRERATVVVWRDEVLLLGVTAGAAVQDGDPARPHARRNRRGRRSRRSCAGPDGGRRRPRSAAPAPLAREVPSWGTA